MNDLFIDFLEYKPLLYSAPVFVICYFIWERKLKKVENKNKNLAATVSKILNFCMFLSVFWLLIYFLNSMIAHILPGNK